MSSHLAHEGNAEETFSLSGKLSSSNGKTTPGFLATTVRINKNRALCDPSWKQILDAYKKKHRKLPTLGEDVTDEEDNDASGEESEHNECDSD